MRNCECATNSCMLNAPIFIGILTPWISMAQTLLGNHSVNASLDFHFSSFFSVGSSAIVSRRLFLCLFGFLHFVSSRIFGCLLLLLLFLLLIFKNRQRYFVNLFLPLGIIISCYVYLYMVCYECDRPPYRRLFALIHINTYPLSYIASTKKCLFIYFATLRFAINWSQSFCCHPFLLLTLTNSHRKSEWWKLQREWETGRTEGKNEQIQKIK